MKSLFTGQPLFIKMDPCIISSNKLGRVAGVIDIGISTQTGSLKSSSPSAFWFSTSCGRSMVSSSLLFSTSRKPFPRQEVYGLWSATRSCSNTTALSGSLQFRRGSEIGISSTSSARNFPCHLNQIIPEPIGLQQIEEDKKRASRRLHGPLAQQVEGIPLHRATDCKTPEATLYKAYELSARDSKRMKERNYKSVLYCKNCGRRLETPRVRNIGNGNVRLEGLQDGSANEKTVLADSFCKSRLDCIGTKGVLQSSCNYECDGSDLVHQQAFGEPYELDWDAETRFRSIGGNAEDVIAVNDVPILDLSKETESSLRQIAKKSVQPNGSFSWNLLENSKERLSESAGVGTKDVTEKDHCKGKSAILIDDLTETYIKPINMKDELGIHLPDLRKRLSHIYDKVLVVDDVSVARGIVEMLTTQYRHLVHACDTEVAKIDVKQETPVDHGEVICFSVFSGPGVDFGNGKSCIWVNVLDGGGRDLLVEFAPFFEDPSIKKVWHNYSFDSHVIENYGLKVAGFHADTMHMARLWDSSRRTKGGYSLEALTSDPKVMSGVRVCKEGELIGKISMKTIFGKRKVKKDGCEGKIITVAPVEELQREERVPWICYSALDSISTLQLYGSLKRKLMDVEWIQDGVSRGSMYDFYEEYWRPFGELLVQMETEGMLVDRKHLAEIEKVAREEQQVAANGFRKWASKYCPDAMQMNVGSDLQLRQLFFGGIVNRKDPNESLPVSRTFPVPNVDKVIEKGKKVPSKFRKIMLHNVGVEMKTEIYTASGWPSVSAEALKMLAGKVSADFDFAEDADGFEDGSDEIDEKQGPPISENNIDTSAYGTAYDAFGGGRGGREACHAIAALCEMCSIDSLISNFIVPLQENHISGMNGRIHCSLNINTETGRLSARRPNLQNQPALEKDRYKIRQAFIAAHGNSLIVADYGQLELRILAHLSDCKSMLDAFKAGGDFHSRTAMNMYPHIREAVEQKRVLLEWYPHPGEETSPVPLLKDAFASERRKAKMLNFSIAYGKTPIGLARDWKVSVKEAKNTVNLWYKGRQEVLCWQEERKQEAHMKQCVHTLLGRARRFPSLVHASYSQRGHIERAAINTPVQGSAADVAMCAMLEISRNARLKELGWRLLLQVHDEVILEGPTESSEVAKAIVVECMSKPFYGTNFLKVDLSVDAKCAQNWYSAK